MFVLKTLKNALSLLLKGDWHEFRVRLAIVLGWVDLKLTTTEELGLSEKRAHYYSDSRGSDLNRLLESFQITGKDAVIDYGCGKGGVLMTFAKYPFSKITGLEISPELVAIAERNLQKLRIDNVNVLCCDAADFTDLTHYNYIYFFDPFPCAVMAAVIENIKNSLKERPRKVTIIYLNPSCHSTIIQNSPFAKRQEIAHSQHVYYIYSNDKKPKI